MILKTVARKLVYPVAFRLGAAHWAKQPQRRKMILMYHGVTKKPYLQWTPRHMTESMFDRQLRYLKKNYHIVTLGEIFELHRNRVQPDQKTIAITFDDGYVNNLHSALPLLEKYQIPATFFVSAVCTDDPNYVLWSDVMDIIRSQTTSATLNIDGRPFQRLGKYFLFNDSLKQTAADYIKHLTPGRREEVLEKFKKEYHFEELLQKLDPEYFRLLNVQELKTFSDSPFVEIGSHAYAHYNLAFIDQETAWEELKKSKEKLESVIGKTIGSLAYPDGNYNDSILSMSEQLGYSNLIAVTYLQASDKLKSNLLPRFGVSNTTTLESNMIRLSRSFDLEGF